MYNALNESALMKRSLLKHSQSQPFPFQLLVMDYKCDKSIDDYVKYCLFTDRTFLTSLTQRAFLTLLDYFEKVNDDNEYESQLLLDQPSRELILGVVSNSNHLHFIASVDDNPDTPADELRVFLKKLNNFASVYRVGPML